MKKLFWFVPTLLLVAALATPAAADDLTLKGQACTKVGTATVCVPTNTPRVDAKAINAAVKRAAEPKLNAIEKRENERLEKFIDRLLKAEERVEDLEQANDNLARAAADAKWKAMEAEKQAQQAKRSAFALAVLTADELAKRDAALAAQAAALAKSAKDAEHTLSVGPYGFYASGIDLAGAGLGFLWSAPLGTAGLWRTDLLAGLGYAYTADYPDALPHQYKSIHGLGLMGKVAVTRLLHPNVRLGAAALFANNLGNLLEGQRSWAAAGGPEVQFMYKFLNLTLTPFIGVGPKRVWIDPLEGEDVLTETPCGLTVNGDYVAHAWQEEHLKLTLGVMANLAFRLPL